MDNSWYAVVPVRYAKGQVLVRPKRSGTGMKTRAMRLLGALRCRWTHREQGYICSLAKVRKFEKLFADGWDANFFSNELIPPEAEPNAKAQVVRWRTPDSEFRDARNRITWAVWYGPGGVDGEHALEVGRASGGWEVVEYTYVVGQIEEPIDDFLVTTAWVDDDEAGYDARRAAAIGAARIGDRGGDESWASRLPR